MARKTVNVFDVVTRGNAILADSIAPKEVRLGAILMIESVLHMTEKYNGFCYLEKRDVPVGQKPGINRGVNNEDLTYEQRFANTDDTRRKYFVYDD